MNQGFRFFLASLTLLLVSSSFLIARSVAASSVNFAERIYSAMDILDSHDMDKYDQAITLLMMAREQSVVESAGRAVDEAIVQLTAHYNEPHQAFPNDSHIMQATMYLRGALHLNRFKLNQSFPYETDILERLVAAHLFPHAQNPGAIRITADGMEKKELLYLMITYFADSRAVKYDPDVSLVIASKRLSFSVPSGAAPVAWPYASPSGTPSSSPSSLPGNSGTGGGPVITMPGTGSTGSTRTPPIVGPDPQIVFFLPDETYLAPDHQTAVQFAQQIQQTNRDLLGPDFPARSRVKVVGNRLSIQWEVRGFQWAPRLEVWFKDTIVLGNGNRYIFLAADGLRAIATRLRVESTSPALQALTNAAATGAEAFEKALRSKLVGSGIGKGAFNHWFAQDHETIKKIITSKTELEAKSALEDLARTVQEMKAAGKSQEFIAAEQARVAKLIADAKALAASKVRLIDEAAKKVMSDPEFTRLPKRIQDARLLKAAEQASGVKKLFTWDRALKFTSFAFASYHSYVWYQQYHRSTDQSDRDLINERYAVKVINDLIYVVPAVGELGITIDAGGFVTEQALKAANINITLPRTQDLLHRLFRLKDWIQYKRAGTTQFKVSLQRAKDILQLREELKRDPDGVWTDSNLNTLEDGIKSANDGKIKPEELAIMKMNYYDQLQDMARKYAVLILLLNDSVNYDFNTELGYFEEGLYLQFVDKQYGYLSHMENVLKLQLPGIIINPTKPGPKSCTKDPVIIRWPKFL